MPLSIAVYGQFKSNRSNKIIANVKCRKAKFVITKYANWKFNKNQI